MRLSQLKLQATEIFIAPLESLYSLLHLEDASDAPVLDNNISHCFLLY